MSDTVTARYLVRGRAVEETWTGDRVTFERPDPDGGALISIWRGGRIAEQVSYRTCERIHRVIDTAREDAP